MTKYKKSRLMGMAVNVIVMLVCFALVKMEFLGLVPMVVMAFSAISIFGYAMGYFFNDDEEAADLDETAKTITRTGADGLSESRKK